MRIGLVWSTVLWLSACSHETPVMKVDSNWLEEEHGWFNETRALQMVGYAAVVTCDDKRILKEWSCKFCQHGGGSIAAPPPLTQVEVLKSSDGINQAFVGVDLKNRRIVASFRGSVSPSQWIFDIDVRLAEEYERQGCHKCWVHEGFYDAFEELAAPFLSRVSTLSTEHNITEIWMTGHSLGAAMALHGALTLQSYLPDLRITGYTFGQPRVGDKAFALWAHQKLPNWVRVVNYLDPVVQCVKLPGYHHMPSEVWYYEKPRPGSKPGKYHECSRENGEDPTCQNKKCGGFKLCLDGSYHVTYMNIQGITNTTLLC